MNKRKEITYEINENGCHVCTSHSVDRHGYPLIMRKEYKSKVVRMHRYIWHLNYGEISENICVCHKCDNRRCINPEHLFLGTIRDNNVDCKIKGRHIGFVTKLDKDKVRRIKTMMGKWSQSKIAQWFGVSPCEISCIAIGIRWAEVTI